MHLFIFNFSKVTKIILIFLVMFIAYNIFLIFCHPVINSYQSQRQKSYGDAQEFIYGDKVPNVIVGSSLASRLQKDLLPVDYFNISFGGGSALSGLEVIKRTGYIPKYIYIESNLIFRSKNVKMIDSLFYPVLWKVKAYLPALQEKYQLPNLRSAKSMCPSDMNVKKKIEKEFKKYKITKKNTNNKTYNMMMKKRVIQYNNMPLHTDKLKDLKALINYFETKGTKVVFFEMPIDTSLANSKKSVKRRQFLKNNFDNKSLPLSNTENYNTSDGHHLKRKSAYNYTNIFVNQTKKLKN